MKALSHGSCACSRDRKPSIHLSHTRKESHGHSTHVSSSRPHNLSHSLVASPLFSLSKSLDILVQRGSESSLAQGVVSPTQLCELVDFTQWNNGASRGAFNNGGNHHHPSHRLPLVRPTSSSSSSLIRFSHHRRCIEDWHRSPVAVLHRAWICPSDVHSIDVVHLSSYAACLSTNCIDDAAPPASTARWRAVTWSVMACLHLLRVRPPPSSMCDMEVTDAPCGEAEHLYHGAASSSWRHRRGGGPWELWRGVAHAWRPRASSICSPVSASIVRRRLPHHGDGTASVSHMASTSMTTNGGVGQQQLDDGGLGSGHHGPRSELRIF
jgi:hypothetical protein